MFFAHPHLLWWYAALPALLALFIWARQRRRRDLVRFAGSELAQRLVPPLSRAWRINRMLAIFLFWAFALFALARPRFGSSTEMVERTGVDVIVALDVSHSMLARDIAPNRIDRAKHEIGKLLDLLRGDRFGLVVFAGAGFVQCPLTLDYATARMFLNVVDTDWIPLQGTDIGGAIRMASRAFASHSRKYKVLIIISDGEEHDGDALKAAAEAAEQGVRIFTIGIGSPSGSPIPVGRGSSVEYLKDRQGNLVMTRLDPLLLERIALAANGAYFHAGPSFDLTAIYAQIAAMEKRELGMNLMSMRNEQYQIFLLIALAFLLLEFLMPEGVRHTHDWRGRFEA